MRPDLFEALSAIWSVHRRLKKPAELGRVMDVKRRSRT
jgi:hypothetical protein